MVANWVNVPRLRPALICEETGRYYFWSRAVGADNLTWFAAAMQAAKGA